MIVTRSNFDEVLESLSKARRIALDCETTGLRPYHGDRLFSLILAPLKEDSLPSVSPLYFNFWAYPDLDGEMILPKSYLRELALLWLDSSKLWFMHNALFDMAMLAREGIHLSGEVHDTMIQARVLWNIEHSYTLGACTARIGFKKDETVDQYIEEQGLWDWVQIPGKIKRDKKKYFYKVPFPMISQYGEMDGYITAQLGYYQQEQFKKLPPTVDAMERRLSKTIFRMQERGVLIDQAYCLKAQAYESDRAAKAKAFFKQETGHDFKASPKLFEEIFAPTDKERFQYTELGNLSFDSDALEKFQNPLAKVILEYRDAKSKTDVYAGFLYHCDAFGVLHPNFLSGGARSGRFASANPNLQNLASEYAAICRGCGEEHEHLATVCGACGSSDLRYPEFLVRRAIIPRPGCIFMMSDYRQQEYRLMFDRACQMVGYESEIVRGMRENGLDPHDATSKAVTAKGYPLTRKRAKNGNFALLYGSGNATLAWTIGATVEEAKMLRQAIFKAAPEINTFIERTKQEVYSLNYVRNWAGRVSQFPPSKHGFAYKAPNYVVQGGCADVTKMAMNQIDEHLLGKKSKLILTVHDELVLEVPEDELEPVEAGVRRIMEEVYPSKFLPLLVDVDYSRVSLADKSKIL